MGVVSAGRSTGVSAAVVKKTASGRRVPALDGVRGFAILFVLFRHAWPHRFSGGGFSGVELFFVLSGFLISSILLRDLDRQRLSLGRFYLNRVLRLVPALILVVTCVALFVTVRGQPDEPGAFHGIVSGLTYSTDLPWWPFASFTELKHLWTLAIEEQFYLFWPILLVLLARRGARRLGAAIGLAAAAAALSATIATHGRDYADLYTWPSTWAITLLAGCAFAVGLVTFSAPARVADGAIIALSAVAVTTDPKDSLTGYAVVLPIVALLGLVLVANGVSDRPSVLLTNAPMRYLGTISYGAYLWNLPIVTYVSPAASIPATIAVASASYWGYERFFLQLKRESRERRNSTAVGARAAIAVAATTASRPARAGET